MQAYCVCGRVRLESSQSDPSVTEPGRNTNILLTVQTGQIHKQIRLGGSWHEKGLRRSMFPLIELRSIYQLSFANFSIDLFWCNWPVFLLRSRCLPSISSRSNVWRGVSRKQWPALASCVTGVRWRPDSCCPVLSFPLCVSLSCFSLLLASCSREQLCLFLHHHGCLVIYGAQKA